MKNLNENDYERNSAERSCMKSNLKILTELKKKKKKVPMMYSGLRMKDKLFLACAVLNQLLLQSSLQALCPHSKGAAHTPGQC